MCDLCDISLEGAFMSAALRWLEDLVFWMQTKKSQCFAASYSKALRNRLGFVGIGETHEKRKWAMSNGVVGSFVWPFLPLLFLDTEGHSSAPYWSENIDWRLKEVTVNLEVWKEWKPCSVTYCKWTATPYSTFLSGHALQHFAEQHLLHQKESTPPASLDWPWRGMFSLSFWMRTQLGKERECQVTYALYTHSLLWEMVSSVLSVFWRRCSKTVGKGLGFISQRKGDFLSSDDITGYQKNTTVPY